LKAQIVEMWEKLRKPSDADDSGTRAGGPVDEASSEAVKHE